jgi:hypothetical protein
MALPPGMIEKKKKKRAHAPIKRVPSVNYLRDSPCIGLAPSVYSDFSEVGEKPGPFYLRVSSETHSSQICPFGASIIKVRSLPGFPTSVLILKMSERKVKIFA